MTFEDFMNEVDDILLSTIGCISDDLFDFNYREAYEAGEDPQETVDCLIEELDM